MCGVALRVRSGKGRFKSSHPASVLFAASPRLACAGTFGLLLQAVAEFSAHRGGVGLELGDDVGVLDGEVFGFAGVGVEIVEFGFGDFLVPVFGGDAAFGFGLVA